MSATRQELLLKALESTKEGSCIIASGPSDLLERVASSRFSERLFYRLNTVHIVIPPLRARQDDVPDLVRYFLGTYSAEGAEPPQLSLAAHRCLVHHAWPGNVGQLKRVVQRLTQPGLGRIVRPRGIFLAVFACRAPRKPAGCATVPAVPCRLSVALRGSVASRDTERRALAPAVPTQGPRPSWSQWTV